MATSIQARRSRQVWASIPHYLRELRRIRGMSELWYWVYYKFPGLFPLRDFPVNVEIEVTNECNFACPHCPRTVINRSRGTGFMEMTVYRKVIEEVVGKVYQVQLVGLGEPSLHPEFDEIMKLLRDNKITTVLNTNG